MTVNDAWAAIVKLARKLLQIERDAAAIVAPISRIVKELEEYAAEKWLEANDHEAEAEDLVAAAKAKRLASEQAKTTAQAYSSLTIPQG